MTDRPWRSSEAGSYLAAVVATAGMVLLRWLMDPVVGNSLPLATLYGAVALAVWIGGYRPALLAVVAGYLACDYLFIEPRGSFGPHDFRNLIGLILYLFSCVIIIGFGEAMWVARRRTEASRQDALDKQKLLAQEITERKQAEAELRRAEEQSRSVVENVLDGIITIDEWGVVQSFNPGAERLFGYSVSEVIGQNVKILMEEPYHSHHDGYIANYLRTGKARIIGIGREVEGRRKDGSTFPMDLAVSEFRLGERRYFTGIVRDITRWKQLEQQLRERAEQLVEADRRKDDFLATLAHELRNPLAPVRNALQILHIRGPAVPELQWARDVIDRQMQQMTRLIDDLLDVSRIGRGKIEFKRERVELAKVVQGAVETSRPLIEQHGHDLIVAMPREPLYLDADLTRLAQVFSNLLNNAAKYTERGGRIFLTAERQGSDVAVSVKDNGIGIPLDKLPCIFEMFSQVQSALERSQGGLGIGLSLVKRLVEMHGGTIEAHSEGPGKGSEFVVRLPIMVEHRGVLTPGDHQLQDTLISRLRILIVDDNRDAADSLGMMLRIMGHNIRTAYDGEDAVRAAREFRPQVVLLDIGLPKLSGYDACRCIREHPWGQNMAVIAVTGWGQDEDKRKAEEAGFDRHLVKPVDPQALINLLAELQTTTVLLP